MNATVIITNYNQSNILDIILDNLNKQNTDYNFNIIVTDDGSSNVHTTKTLKLLRNYKKEIFYIFQQDLGFRAAKARNNAIKLSNSDIIITLDGDCIPNSDFIQKHMEIFEQNKNCNILTYSNRKHKEINEIKLNESNSEYKRQLYFSEIEIKNKMKNWQRAWTFNISFNKSSYTLFDENFKGWGLEDTDFSYNLIKNHNYKLIEIKEPLVTHIHIPLTNQSNPFRTRKAIDMLNFIENAIYFYEKYKDEEILATFNTIPDFAEFCDKKFTLESKILTPQKQTIQNLKKQALLYKNFINNKE